MLNKLESHVLVNTVFETDTELELWTQKLTSDRYLELGDDPELISQVEQTLQHLAHKIRLLGPQFGLSRVPLSRANDYFAATQQFDRALALVQSIQEKAYGSQQNTRQCVAQLSLCAESVRRISLNAHISDVKH